ncbi:YopX family protein [Campylobacter coli]
MKLKDFDFRIWDKYHKGCGNKDCKCQTKYVYGEEAKTRLSEFKEDCEIELFTGLYDKNGNKIYEGDILYYFKDCSEGEVFKYQVLFKEGAFYLFESYDGFVDDEDLIAEFDLRELQVMGNIHENSELIKEI